MRTQSMVMAAFANAALTNADLTNADLFNAAPRTVPSVHVPLHYYYGGGHKIATNLVNPKTNVSVEVVFDQGSENFWVFGPNSINNWGCTGLFCPGQCNVTVDPFYDYPNSPTASKPEPFASQYAYGAYTKIVQGKQTVNDTFHFASESGLTSDVQTRVAISDYMQQRLMDGGSCIPTPYDLGIFGVAPFYRTPEWNTSGPHVRQDLLERGIISAPVQSIWFDEAPENWNGTFTGNAIFGAIDHSKYVGSLVKVPAIKNDRLGASVGYFVAPPVVSVKNTSFPNTALSSNACMIDSGTQVDDLPINIDALESFFEAAGLTRDPIGHIAWNGTCDSIPVDLTIDLTFDGAGNQNVTVAVPLRNYARNAADITPGYCMLNIDVGGCMLAAPFATAAFFAANDEANEIAFAQGGVSARGSKPNEGAFTRNIELLHVTTS